MQTLINMYRVRGHLIAHLDPLDAEPPHIHPELDPLTYGLTIWDLPRQFVADGLAGRETATLEDILHVLRDAYCRTLGIEYMHIQDPEQKRWIQQHVEGQPTTLNLEEQRHILDRLNAAEVFERFLHTRYVGQKRFGLEGAESTIVLLDALLDAAAGSGVAEVVMGMAHRGRLNVLANIVGKSYKEIFEEFEGNLDPESVQGSGDVKYHKGARGVFRGSAGEELPITLASNPSHLEAVDPVVEGMTRAKQDRVSPPTDGTPAAAADGTFGFPCMSVLVHGDAAFAGQGVVAETLNLSGLSGYRTGGTVHVVINNQLGFTTAPTSARTSVYPTDVAKMVQAPIFHVNGDDPEACVRAARLAFAFRQTFHKDVVIDLVCYRKHGHNEGDDPSYTQPLMYQRIEAKRSVRKLYTETLVRRGDITLEEAESALDDFNAKLQAVLDEVRQEPSLAPTELPVPDPGPVAIPTGRDRRRARCAAGAVLGRALRSRRVHGPPQARAPVRPARRARRQRAGRLGARRGARHRLAACTRASTCASRVRTPAAGPSATATQCWSTTPTARSTSRWPTSATACGASGPTSSSRPGRWATSPCGTPCSRSTPPSASSTATPSRRPRRSSPGRPSSATSSTGRRSSSTTSSWPPRTSGASTPASCCSCRTGTRARGPSTPRPGSSASSR